MHARESCGGFWVRIFDFGQDGREEWSAAVRLRYVRSNTGIGAGIVLFSDAAVLLHWQMFAP